jgi:hypothetical protein
VAYKSAVSRVNWTSIFAASALSIGLAFSARAQTNLEAQERPAAVRSDAPIAIRPLPQEAVSRYDKLNAVLQPSVKAWVETQARIELQRPSPDIASLEAAIRARFSGAGSAVAHTPPATGIPAGADIEELIFVVLMEATNDQNQDLQQIMNEVQAQTKAKQALRNLLNVLQSDIAANANQQAAATCNTPACQSIVQQLAQVESLTSQAHHPVHFNISSKPTYGQLRQAQAVANEASDSLNDMSTSMQMKLQLEMSRYAQVMEAMSNIEKTMSDTSNSIIQNLK